MTVERQSLLRHFRLRLRRGFVWWPKRCVNCGRPHLNGWRTHLPYCVPCAYEFLGQFWDGNRG
jgi:hypothetical protein